MTQSIVPSPRREATLAQQMRDYAADATAESTKRVYRIAWADFIEFCADHRLASLPATPETVAAYITTLAQGKMKISTIRVRVSAISKAHVLARHPDPTADVDFKQVFTGIRRDHGTAPTKKEPITLDVLTTLLAHLPAGLVGVRDRALLIVDYGGVFRRSELAALNVGDVSIKGNHMTIVVRRGKTDQEGKGLVKHFPMLENADLCPLRAMLAWFEQGAIATGPIWRPIDRWGKIRDKRLSDHAVNEIIKRAVKRAGLNEEDYAGHSMRRGGITQMLAADVSQFKVMDQSGHRDVNTLREYNQDAGTGALEAVRAAFGEL